MELVPLGKVQSCYPDKFGTPRQSGLVPNARAFLGIQDQFQPEISLQGLEQFSHLWVLFQFHKNNLARFHAKVHPPRLQGESIGLFATRSPHRPNALGLSVVQIEKVVLTGLQKGVWVRGVDFIDGTPFFDIKPYIAEDRIEAPTLGWTLQPGRSAIEVQWRPNSLMFKNAASGNLIQLIEQTLRLDPRPVVYRGFEGLGEGQVPYRSQHSVRIESCDIHFHFESEFLIHIDRVDELEIRRDHGNSKSFNAN